jgi:hypothetical protein
MTNTLLERNLATEGEKVPVWIARPFQLVSLLEMIEFRADLFISYFTVLAKYL